MRRARMRELSTSLKARGMIGIYGAMTSSSIWSLLVLSTMPQVERPAMADYGVPIDPAGALPWTWAQERLVRNKNYWVVTASANGRPHALPVWGVWLAETDR